MSCVVTRSWSPERRTLPSTTAPTASRSPIVATSSPRCANADVRAITRSASIRESASINSSAIPSPSQALSAAGLMSWNGSTAIAVIGAPDGHGARRAR